ncbi:nucleotide exchange factor GrpE [Candidatus Peregrinibacteria bacterium]|nr:nucleotide exchange factor GrpE [Candidatus Peregrinibacteria bacterium]
MTEEKKPQTKQAQQSRQTPAAPRTNGEIETLKKELEAMTEMAKRTMADLINLKRRHEDERQSMFMLANATLISQLLPILDNLERARQHVPETAKEWFQGIEICINQLNQTLQAAGVKPIESLGQTFNPNLHEALAQGPGEKDKVIEELEKGYMLGDRVLRHAKVKVGS